MKNCRCFKVALLSAAFLLYAGALPAAKEVEVASPGEQDRKYWADLLYKISEPVLSSMSRGELVKNMEIELSPTWDGRSKTVTYMEAFGRLMAGLAPWLTLPPDDTDEGKQRGQLLEWALKSYANAVNPDSPDYLEWKREGQPLVDAAYIANSFLRAPKQLWEPLDDATKQRFVKEFKGLRRVQPPYSNWLLFGAMVETFLLSVGEDYDAFRISIALRKVEEWYVGDGWYSDGPRYAFDYYNSYVIHPMYVEILEVLAQHKKINTKGFEPALKRMQRYGEILERMISPEGTFPAVGRSITYRLAVFQPLALMAWKYQLPQGLTYGQVRAALTATMMRMFAVEGSFSKSGYLQLGFAGHQPHIADYYTNNGSLYITSLAFLPLGLPASHPFWTDAPQDWTSKKAWSGQEFPRDHASE
ncbi:MAG: DUF2264 domain-containing protein [Prevotellaceae bacterium]|jgi:hypothetical protein|nr:DUF2264 domain-containing protein [Prevotellaceae bacterium]